jgi:putative transcriptional regulator
MNRHKPIATPRWRKNRIALIRSEKGWRQLDLARRLDKYQSEISSIERGEREPGVYLAKRIARALGTSIDEIF